MAVAIYPNNFKQKIGFTEVVELLRNLCSSPMGQELVEQLEADNRHDAIERSLAESSEMFAALHSGLSLPSLHLTDCREALVHIRPQRTYMEGADLIALGNMLSSLHTLHRIFILEQVTGAREDDSLCYTYPHLATILSNAPLFPKIEQHIEELFDAEQRIKDTASRELWQIRKELQETERSLSGMLHRILRTAQREGWVGSDVSPAMRDGRLVIPVEPQHKRKIRGIVHDESSTGKTVYIEPVELVEANNRIRELEADERREVIRILIEVANRIRPSITHLIKAYDIIAHIDLVLAKARWASKTGAICPPVLSEPHLRWHNAKHPLLMRTLHNQGRELIPLDIELNQEGGRILIISGPNAGGKSVCLKTVGLLQYMLQCGIPVPMGDGSEAGIFSHFFIDIGDEQSIEDDLSTYSSHLKNMKHIERYSDERTLILIDEFGGGTEPSIGGAIAQALLERFNERKAYGVITTHYQNLKTFAEDTPGLINGAMLYDRHHMQPLFKLSIGRPGSSFAVEIARKIGLPEVVIARASEYVGSDYIDMDKYLQDIVRDKRYWEQKRLSVRREERRLQEASEVYDSQTKELKQMRQTIIKEAKQEAERIIQEANKRIERTIREIREAQAEKERTQSLRAELRSYQTSLEEDSPIDLEAQSKAQREVEKLLRRRERKQKGGSKAVDPAKLRVNTATSASTTSQPQAKELQEGDLVYLDGTRTTASILSIDKDKATIAAGVMKMTVPISRLTRRTTQIDSEPHLSKPKGTTVIDQIREKRLNFRQDIDLRGMRVNEAMDTVMYFIDDAIQLGVSRVRILHGTGTGALRASIRDYLSGVPSVRHYADEHVQLGGAGITVVDLE